MLVFSRDYDRSDETAPRHARSTMELLDSVCALAFLAVQDTGAKGFSYFRRTDPAGGVELTKAFGAPIPEEALYGLSCSADVIVYYPLATATVTDAFLAFAFATTAKADEAKPQLDTFVSLIQRLRSAQNLPEAYLEAAFAH